MSRDTIRLGDVSRFAYADMGWDQWLPMWRAYVGTSSGQVTDEVTRHTFQRVCDPASSLLGFAAGAGQPQGFVHYYFHPSTYGLNDACTLEDLFVDPSARGRGLGRWLIQAVASEARARAAPALYWRTSQSNHRAIALYESLARRLDTLHFRMDL